MIEMIIAILVLMLMVVVTIDITIQRKINKGLLDMIEMLKDRLDKIK